MGAAESKEIESRLRGSTVCKATFPISFNINYTSKSNLKLVLCEHKDRPSNMFSLPNGWFGELILYRGPDVNTEPLAVVRNAGKVGQHDSVELAPVQPGMQPIQEEMRYYSRGLQVGYSFAGPVGNDHVQRERFEWRSSRSDQVRDLGEKTMGWELVRLDYKDEVVAVWSEAKLKMSLTQTAAFRFVGSGATGEMGSAWAVMAVVSCLRIWQRQQQMYVRNGLAAA